MSVAGSEGMLVSWFEVEGFSFIEGLSIDLGGSVGKAPMNVICQG